MEKELTAKVELQGRALEVRSPTAEQVMLARRMSRQVRTDKSLTGAQALDVLESGMAVVESILVEKDDVVWLNSQMLSGKIGIVEAASVVSMAIRKLWRGDKKPKDHLKKQPKAKLVKD